MINFDFELVVYDMDGLMVDSEPFWRAAEIKVFSTVGHTLTEDDCKQTTGYRFDEVIDFWFQKKPWSNKSKHEVHDEVIDEMETMIRNHGEPMVGLQTSLDFFKKKGVKMAVASSSPMRLIKAVVERLGLESYFDLLVSAEHEKYGKPHPAVFIKAAEMLNITPHKCLVLEDSFYGVVAAKAAKMKCIAVPDKEHFYMPGYVIADAKIKSLSDIQDCLK